MKVVDMQSVSFPEGLSEYLVKNGLKDGKTLNKLENLAFLFCRIEGLTVGTGKGSLLQSLQHGESRLSVLLPDNSIVDLNDKTDVTLEAFLQQPLSEEEEVDFGINLTSSAGGKKKSKSKSKPNSGKSKGKKKANLESESGWLFKDAQNDSLRLENAKKRLVYSYNNSESSGGPQIFEISLYSSLLDRKGVEQHPVEINIEQKNLNNFCGEVEFICLVEKNDLLRNVLTKIRASLKKQLDRFTTEQLHQVTFLNDELGFPLTVSFPSCYNFEAEEEKDQVKFRKELHEILDLPVDKPVFTRFQSLLNVVSRNSKTVVDNRPILRSPHLGPFAKDHGIEGAKTFLISGDFDYYHYGVGYNDKGWGCAYRSLQMVMSWYELAGLTDSKPLSILEIQQSLLNMGVMDADFDVGCNQWIGSQEVSWLLDSVCGASSRFIVCTRGSEILEKSRELSQHFLEQQTPIVICGADPHYTGDDDLKQVQTKIVSLEGYKAIPVSWRGAEAFTDRSSYNLCLPQRKLMI